MELSLKEINRRFIKAYNLLSSDRFTYNEYLSYLHEIYYYYDSFYFFTFGSDAAFPYQNGYIIIIAKDIDTANKIFKENYPNRPGSDCLNYSFCYTSDEWDKIDTSKMGIFYGFTTEK